MTILQQERLKELEQRAKDNFLEYSDVNLVEWLDTEEERKEYSILFNKFCDWMQRN